MTQRRKLALLAALCVFCLDAPGIIGIITLTIGTALLLYAVWEVIE